jgi:beta-phosphoglucomutase-like phosphatase (HAD superfamily)
METAAWNLHALGVGPDTVPVVTPHQVKYAKPDPDLFLAAGDRLDTPIEATVIISNAIWDMLVGAAAASGSACFLATTARKSWGWRCSHL